VVVRDDTRLVTSLWSSPNERLEKTALRETSESEDSSLHLYSPENAVACPTAPIVMEQGTPTVTVDRVHRDLILDTGSNISILQPEVSRSDVRCTSIKPYG